ncbi:DNA-binding transcriptional ArsR family regulator [Actinoalloteichus hoggarensis]|uniref:Transcriptional repressor SdpR n=1 Tax=Actinoalloteichus hoggarensis TaxID=1470176 RepID=A0A221VZY2_9PSEU|nr:metalloregulator ArsR/SmtB family transcription factor [Actinoalloteichus hoggarensis]ASO19064.1 Transcriptional repressor SdpR [Actinoalloteichus hoggarensis]MBB5920302.1 DNA-binding transcriptional ArsR family regulator [Actinoalloteichus hoggarensis]
MRKFWLTYLPVDRFEALGEPHRRRIVELVADRARNAGEIATHFTISRPAVSQHLRVLTETGVLAVTVHGRQRVYSLDPTAFEEVENWLDAQRERWARALDSLEEAMEAAHRPSGETDT